jgi:hypothetical protein
MKIFKAIFWLLTGLFLIAAFVLWQNRPYYYRHEGLLKAAKSDWHRAI